MVFFGEKDPEFVELVISTARDSVCEKIGMTQEDFETHTTEIVIDERIDGPWTVSFLVKNQGKALYQVDIDPATMM
jgi:hypothetical protein